MAHNNKQNKVQFQEEVEHLEKHIKGHIDHSIKKTSTLANFRHRRG